MSNKIGGKKFKRGKKNNILETTNEKLILANNNQVYGVVKTNMGDKRFKLLCSDNIERIGLIPGRFFKKVWLNSGDVVLCTITKENNDKEDCLIDHKYTNKHIRELKNLKLLQNNSITEQDIFDNNSEDDNNIKIITDNTEDIDIDTI